ncbi:manganese efflux pump [Tumebacillus sp. ITR2]|uniref:Manganese efflux pump n=2 Tax=Tumebacillus amylolyticus TaxID=2801339 RepID=A0ABS1J5W4_9BACL|nr:manganese efflux pump [Tumebacillus amylolyticus]
MLALVFSLGLDTLVLATTLGTLQRKGKVKLAISFALAEAIMPLVGFLLGKNIGEFIGGWASLVGAVALIGLGIYLIFFEEEDEDEELERGQSLRGWAFLLLLLMISLDELAVGFSMGLVGVSAPLTVLLIALQSFVFTLLGLTFGAKLKPYLGEWAEKAGGVVLVLLGVWLLGERF